MHQSSAVYRPSDPELWEFHQLWSLEHIMISEGREKAQQQWENRSKSSCSFFGYQTKNHLQNWGYRFRVGIMEWVGEGLSGLRRAKPRRRGPGGQRRQALGSCVRGPACCRRGGCSVRVHTVGSGSVILTDDYILKKDDAVVTVFCL